jgi:hypothetical protein
MVNVKGINHNRTAAKGQKKNAETCVLSLEAVGAAIHHAQGALMQIKN